MECNYPGGRSSGSLKELADALHCNQLPSDEHNLMSSCYSHARLPAYLRPGWTTMVSLPGMYRARLPVFKLGNVPRVERCIADGGSVTWLRSDCEQAVASPTYARLLLKASKILGAGPTYYSLWPVHIKEPPWLQLVERVYEAVQALPVVHTEAGGAAGQWMTPSEVVYASSACLRYADYSTMPSMQVSLKVVNC